jgi:hypothetical protein
MASPVILCGARIAFSVSLLAATLTFADAPNTNRMEIPQASQPQLAVGSDGRVWLTYAKAGDVFVACSNDDGATFAQPTKIGTVPHVMVGMRRGPRIAAQGDRVTVTVIAHELIAFHSGDGGETWSDAVTINDVPTSAREGLHDLTRAANGKLFVTWLDLRNGTMELWGAESNDAGRTWENDEQIYRSPDTSICTCCQPSAMFDASGTLAVIWRNSIGGSRDMWLATRSNGAKEFTSARKLGEGTWKIDGCPMDGGRILAVDAGNFATVWQRAGEVFFCSTTGAEINLGQGKQPVAMVCDGEPIILWQQGTQLVSTRVSSNKGPTKHADDGRFPVLVPLKNGRGAILAYEYGPPKEPSVAIERIL